MADTAIDTGYTLGGFDFRPPEDEVVPGAMPPPQPAVPPAPAPEVQAPLVQPAQQRAIETAIPQPEYDHDADIAAWNNDWMKASGVVRQHYGNYKELAGDGPSLEEIIAQDPRQVNVANASRIAQEALKAGQVDQKTYNNKLVPEINKVRAQIRADATAKHREARNLFLQQHREAIQSAEAKEGGSAFRERAGDLELQTKQEEDRLAALVESAGAEDLPRLKASIAVSAPKTLGQAYLPIATRLSLKNNLLGTDAARLMNVLTEPGWGKERGFNGYRGRAAANFKVVGVDAADNYMIMLPEERGVLRINQNDLRAIERARYAGYDILRKMQADNEARRNQPGLLDSAYNWAKRQLE